MVTGRRWTDARPRDLEDFEDWRLRAPQNPERVGASKWDRELAAFSGLFSWAAREGYLPANPVVMQQGVDFWGRAREVPAASVRPAGKEI